MNRSCMNYSNERKKVKTQPADHKDTQEALTMLLNQLGIPRNTAGYNYLLRIALKINAANNMNMKLTKELYPQIAAELGSSATRIERGIRYSIETGWYRNKDAFRNVLGYYYDSKPYAGEFIWLLADKLRTIECNNS